MSDDIRRQDEPPDELSPFLRAAQPLGELTRGQRVRIKACLLGELRHRYRARSGLRWSTVLVALGLMLVGGVVSAAAMRLGLIPWAGRNAANGDARQEQKSSKPSGRRHARLPSTKGSATVQDGLPAGSEDWPAPAAARGPVEASTPFVASQTVTLPVPPSPPEPNQGAAASKTPSGQDATGNLGVRVLGLSAAPAPRSASVVPATNRARHMPALAGLAVTPGSASRSKGQPLRMATAVPLSASRPQPEAQASTGRSPQPVDEQTTLNQALRQLRQNKDAAGALALLESLATAYPHSTLATERWNLQVEALLALGREGEALNRLDQMSLDQLPRAAERHVLRGELRSRHRRWREALEDFHYALDHASGTPSWYERALWGRGVARTHLGDSAGARTDLENYLKLYPAGLHSTEAEKLIAPSM